MSKGVVNIIGAGISGLHAAYLLEKEGFEPVIWEKSDRVGGRMKTDIHEGYQLDQGFQVLLDAYPFLNEALDFKQLELQHLLPGAAVIKSGKKYLWGDPLRNPAIFRNTAFSPLGSLSDKWKVFKLRNELRKKELSDHFKEEGDTLDYLRAYGFSDTIIDNFFRPFFSGIFLEDQLKTSASMFCFVFSLFSKGSAVIPKSGIEAIPRQLLSKLEKTKIHYNTGIDRVESGSIFIDGVDKIESEHTLICTEPSALMPQLQDQSTTWNSLDTFYYEVSKDVFGLPIIGLLPEAEFINHVYFPQSVKTSSIGKQELMSVNVVNSKGLEKEALLKEIEAELSNHLGLRNARLIKHYAIPNALPKFDRMQYAANKEECVLIDGVYLAGDQQLNPSQNAALASAEAAVEAIIAKEELSFG